MFRISNRLESNLCESHLQAESIACNKANQYLPCQASRQRRMGPYDGLHIIKYHIAQGYLLVSHSVSVMGLSLRAKVGCGFAS